MRTKNACILKNHYNAENVPFLRAYQLCPFKIELHAQLLSEPQLLAVLTPPTLMFIFYL